MKKKININCFKDYLQKNKNYDISVLKIKVNNLNNEINNDMKCLILDFTALSYVDPSGIVMLKSIGEEFKNIQIPIYVAGCSGKILFKKLFL